MTLPPSAYRKYHNRLTEVDGITFHSAKEARRYQDLRLLERGGEISGLKLQPRFDLEINGVRVCRYVADFDYIDRRLGRVVEDVKGLRTPVYRLKAKLLYALHGIRVRET